MAGDRPLKVFVTPIGFHDAYVAASSQKAALAAWGADSNLFAAGSAERVDDPALMREPLAHPGQVIRRLRGTLAEHIAALPKDAPPRAKRAPRPTAEPASAEPPARPTPAPAPRAAPQPKPKPEPKPAPRPSRTALDRAEAALAAAEAEHAAARAAIARQQSALDRARHALAARQEQARGKLQERLDAAHAAYDAKMRAWRDA